MNASKIERLSASGKISFLLKLRIALLKKVLFDHNYERKSLFLHYLH